MNKVWLGLISLGLGAFIFCANSPTDLGFFSQLYLIVFVSKTTFLLGYFAPSIFKKVLPSLSYHYQPLRLPRFK